MATKSALKAPKICVVISDLHCGSDVGLLPKTVEMEDGHTVGHGKNRWQKWLWESWEDAMRRLLATIGTSPFHLVLNGDMIEGVHHRSDEVVAMKLVEHLRIAKTALDPLVKKAAEITVIRGTECHTHDFETVLARQIGQEKAYDFRQVEINGVLCDIRHHMPVTSRLHLEASAMSIVIANNRSNAIRSRHRAARVFIRGHRHIAGMFSDGESMILCTGAWQGLTRHGKKVVSDAVPRPSIGILDFRHASFGELPAVSQLVYNPPQWLAIEH